MPFENMHYDSIIALYMKPMFINSNIFNVIVFPIIIIIINQQKKKRELAK